MNRIQCDTCKEYHDVDAKRCPHCGHRHLLPTESKVIAGAGAIVLALGLLGVVLTVTSGGWSFASTAALAVATFGLFLLAGGVITYRDAVAERQGVSD